MNSQVCGWESITNEKEKYQAYLCSREWSERKEAIRDRAGGMCERCSVNKMDAVHHLTYARKYNEELEDLQAICNPCHDFIHAKNLFDPVSIRTKYDRYVEVCEECGVPPIPIRDVAKTNPFEVFTPFRRIISGFDSASERLCSETSHPIAHQLQLLMEGLGSRLQAIVTAQSLVWSTFEIQESRNTDHVQDILRNVDDQKKRLQEVSHGG